MKLKLETVAKTYIDYLEIFGTPPHLDTEEKVVGFINAIHRKLSVFFTEESFPLGIRSADSSAMRLPVVSDFVRNVPKEQLRKPPERVRVVRKQEGMVDIELLDEKNPNGGFMVTSMTERLLDSRIKDGSFVQIG